MTEVALVASPPASLELIRPVTSGTGLTALGKEIDGLVKALVPDVDFGLIPGTKTPTLLKPGAEKLAVAFGAHTEYEIVSAECDHDREVKWTKRKKTGWDARRKEAIYEEFSGASIGLYRYVYKCRLVRGDGRVLGEGVGSCSTLEAKYVDRPRDMENTVLKMAQKRALVAAALNSFSLSNRFTQDMEDRLEHDEPATQTNAPGYFDSSKKEHMTRLKAALTKDGLIDSLAAVVAEAEGKPLDSVPDIIAKAKKVHADIDAAFAP